MGGSPKSPEIIYLNGISKDFNQHKFGHLVPVPAAQPLAVLPHKELPHRRAVSQHGAVALRLRHAFIAIHGDWGDAHQAHLQPMENPSKIRGKSMENDGAKKNEICDRYLLKVDELIADLHDLH